MTRRVRIGAVCLAAWAIGAMPRAMAQDASFGCKVLLCAAAPSPGWSAIPYCVPVMQALFQQLSRRQGWPICPEAQRGGVGLSPGIAGMPALAAPSQDKDN